MKRTIGAVALVGALVFLLSACGTTKKQLRNDVNTLNERIAQMEAEKQAQQETVNQLQQALADERGKGAIAQQPSQGSMVSEHVVRSSSSKASSSSSTYFISDKLSNPPSIQDVQGALKNAGVYNGNVDGVAGPMTRKAVQNFQKAQGLSADGIVGKQTWEKLKSYL
jgi:murein L,D-transpeptidase YcbB/YkuD